MRLFFIKEKSTLWSFTHEESHGTQKIFAYAGPIHDVLQNGKVLVVDELDSKLHPKMVRFLVNLIQNTHLNKNNAQLIFTTHNTSLLDTRPYFAAIKFGLWKKIRNRHLTYTLSLTLVLAKVKPSKKVT